MGARDWSYTELSKDITQRCKNDKNKYLNDICDEIEQYSHKNDTRDMFTKIKQITRSFTPKHTAIRAEDDTLLTEKTQIKNRWKTYCETLMKANDDLGNQIQLEREPPILREEVTAPIKKLKAHKLPGADKIVSEMLTAIGDTGIDTLHRICQLIWNQGTWPED